MSALKQIKVVLPKVDTRRIIAEEEKKAGVHAKAVCKRRVRVLLQLPDLNRVTLVVRLLNTNK